MSGHPLYMSYNQGSITRTLVLTVPRTCGDDVKVDLTVVYSIAFIKPPAGPLPSDPYNIRPLYILHIRWLPPCHCPGHRLGCPIDVSSYRCRFRGFIPLA